MSTCSSLDARGSTFSTGFSHCFLDGLWIISISLLLAS